MSIWVTGDCHSDFRRFRTDIFPEQKEMTRDDTMIICGDFGGVWYQDSSEKREQEEWWLNWLEDKSYTTILVDGNHENFDRLYQYPVMEWNGGLVHQIRPHVLHLMRGQVFTIEDKKFFTFGGASSHDISDGILDYDDPSWREKAKRLDKEGKYMYRIKGLSWWEQELPEKKEMEIGRRNLEEYSWDVDFVITHCASASTVALIGQGLYEQDVLTKYLEEIRNKLNYTRWFMGHYHINKQINDKDIILYEQIIRIA